MLFRKWHSEEDFAKQNIKRQKEEISKLTISLRDLETKTAKKSAAESTELNAWLETAKLELKDSCKALFIATNDLGDTVVWPHVFARGWKKWMEVKRGESSTNIRTIIEDALLEERECAVEGDHKGSINLYWGQAGAR